MAGNGSQNPQPFDSCNRRGLWGRDPYFGQKLRRK